jgi:HEAT repeat protein
MPVNFAQMRLMFCLALVVVCGVPAVTVVAQTTDRLTPIQREIEKQRQRLASSEVDERRDALMRLGNLHRPDASRAAVSGLNDAVPAVRVAAAHAIVSLPPDEAANFLLPLLHDRLEFVRREAAYALGETRSRNAVSALVNSLTTDKEISVRAAAAIALGKIGDVSAVPALAQVLTGAPTGKQESKRQPDPFVTRAAAHSLGEIHSASSVNVLIATLSNETNSSDVRREAATALGMIGDSAAIPALRNAFASDDPYLSEAARNALRKMHVAVKN